MATTKPLAPKPLSYLEKRLGDKSIVALLETTKDRIFSSNNKGEVAIADIAYGAAAKKFLNLNEQGKREVDYQVKLLVNDNFQPPITPEKEKAANELLEALDKDLTADPKWKKFWEEQRKNGVDDKNIADLKEGVLHSYKFQVFSRFRQLADENILQQFEEEKQLAEKKNKQESPQKPKGKSGSPKTVDRTLEDQYYKDLKKAREPFNAQTNFLTVLSGGRPKANEEYKTTIEKISARFEEKIKNHLDKNVKENYKKHKDLDIVVKDFLDKLGIIIGDRDAPILGNLVTPLLQKYVADLFKEIIKDHPPVELLDALRNKENLFKSSVPSDLIAKLTKPLDFTIEDVDWEALTFGKETKKMELKNAYDNKIPVKTPEERFVEYVYDNPGIYDALKNFTDKSETSENIEFIRSVEGCIRKGVPKFEDLYERFLKKNASRGVNIDDKIFARIASERAKMQKDNSEEISGEMIDSLKVAQGKIVDLIKRNYNDFHGLSKFKNYLSQVPKDGPSPFFDLRNKMIYKKLGVKSTMQERMEAMVKAPDRLRYRDRPGVDEERKQRVAVREETRRQREEAEAKETERAERMAASAARRNAAQREEAAEEKAGSDVGISGVREAKETEGVDLAARLQRLRTDNNADNKPITLPKNVTVTGTGMTKTYDLKQQEASAKPLTATKPLTPAKPPTAAPNEPAAKPDEKKYKELDVEVGGTAEEWDELVKDRHSPKDRGSKSGPGPR